MDAEDACRRCESSTFIFYRESIVEIYQRFPLHHSRWRKGKSVEVNRNRQMIKMSWISSVASLYFETRIQASSWLTFLESWNDEGNVFKNGNAFHDVDFHSIEVESQSNSYRIAWTAFCLLLKRRIEMEWKSKEIGILLAMASGFISHWHDKCEDCRLWKHQHRHNDICSCH